VFQFFTGKWANSQFNAYQLHQFTLFYRGVEILGQPIFDRGIQAGNEANLPFMGGENVRIYKALLDRATVDEIFHRQLTIAITELEKDYSSGIITLSEYRSLVALNQKVWNPLEAIRSNVLWELSRINDDRGIIPVKTIGDGRVNLVRYEITLGTIGV